MQLDDKNTTLKNAVETRLVNNTTSDADEHTTAYTVEDVSNICKIIKNNEENYIEIYDVDFDNEITKKDLQQIAIAVTTKETYDDIVIKAETIKATNKEQFENSINTAKENVYAKILNEISILGYDSENIKVDELSNIINTILLQTDETNTYEIKILKEMLEDIQATTKLSPSKDYIRTVNVDKILETVVEDVIREEQNKYHADINEQIEDSKQGRLGDCWLLAGLNSLSYSEAGIKLIDEAIENNGNGTYTVTLNGVNISYTLSDEDLENARKSGLYSSGDDDVLLMELAVEKFLKELQAGNITLQKGAPDFLSDEETANMDENPINGGVFEYLIYLLTGECANWQHNCYHPDNDNFASWIQGKLPWVAELCGNSMECVYDKIENSPDGICATISFHGEEGYEGPVVITDINGNDVVLTHGDRGHAWSIKSVDGDYVTIVNPWDSSVEIVVSKDEIEKYATGITYYEF